MASDNVFATVSAPDEVAALADSASGAAETKETKAAEPAPLTDEDIERHRLRAKNVPQNVKNDIFQNVYRELQLLLKLATQHIQNQAVVNIKAMSDIDHIRRLLKLAPNDEIFYRLYPKVWAHRTQLLAKDSEFFISHDYSKLVKDDGKKSMIINIIGIIKYEYKNLKEDDRESLWAHMQKILGYVAMYLKAVNDSKK